MHATALNTTPPQPPDNVAHKSRLDSHSLILVGDRIIARTSVANRLEKHTHKRGHQEVGMMPVQAHGTVPQVGDRGSYFVSYSEWAQVVLGQSQGRLLQ